MLPTILRRVGMQNVRFYSVDLTKISGKGDFECPKCGIKISPDDKTDEVYRILDVEMKGNSLSRVKLQCNKCGTFIKLTGFNVLNNMRIS
jgi:uncharacterized Zn finger protein